MVARLQRSGHEVQFRISHRQGQGILEPLELSLGFFRAAKSGEPDTPGACGVLRISILAPGERRFRPREGDVAMVPESGLEPDLLAVQSEEAP